MNSKILPILLAAALLAAAAMPAAAASPVAGPCTAGGTYDPACDVDHNGLINIVDIQLIAGRFNQNGVFTSDGWLLAGNAATTAGTNFVGTTDNQAFELKVNGSRALRIQPTASSPNLLWGYFSNDTSSNVVGAAIGGGGGATLASANIVGDSFGAVGGGAFNRAGNYDGDPTNARYAAVGGGFTNVAVAQGARAGGGQNNQASLAQTTIQGGVQNVATATRSTVAGGYNNTASGANATAGGGALHFATGDNSRIGGGNDSSTGQENSTVGGGLSNEATSTGSSVGGGSGNWAYTNLYPTIAGGSTNRASGAYSFAAGQYAWVTHDGAFLWHDSVGGQSSSTGGDKWRVQATNGSEFVGNNASYAISSTDNGTGDGIRSLSETSNGTNWAALFASNSGTSPGLYAHSAGTYAARFVDQIFVTGGCTGCTLMAIALNAAGQPLQPGDLVAVRGVDVPLAGTTDPVLRVAPADGDSVLGVVYRGLTMTSGERDGEALASTQAVEGPVQPGAYLLVVVQGLAQAAVSDDAGIVPGQKLTVGDLAGSARALRDVEPGGFNTPVLGIALDAPDPATGLAPVLVTASAH